MASNSHNASKEHENGVIEHIFGTSAKPSENSECSHASGEAYSTTPVNQIPSEEESIPVECGVDGPRAMEDEEKIPGEGVTVANEGASKAGKDTQVNEDVQRPDSPGQDSSPEMPVRTIPYDLPPNGLFCRICEFKEMKSNAEFICEKCGTLLMCEGCFKTHLETPATSQHVVMSLEMCNEVGKKICQVHNMDISKFCETCDQPCCGLCVLLDHGDHDVFELENVIKEEMDKLKENIEVGLKKICELQSLRVETEVVKRLVLDWRSRMVKQVKESTEKAIKRILDIQKRLTEEIEKGSDVPELEKILENVPQVELSMGVTVKKGQGVLDRTSLSPDYLKVVKAVVKEIGSVLNTDEFDRRAHWGRMAQPIPLFQESDSDVFYLGNIHKCSPQRPYDRGMHLFRNLSYQDDTTTIRSVLASLTAGHYAIGLICDDGGECNIYTHEHKAGEADSKLCLSISGIVDLAATPDGNIAILSEGTEANDFKVQHQIKVYATKEKDVVGKMLCELEVETLSLSTTKDGYYLILCKAAGDKQCIVLLSKDGDKLDHLFSDYNDLRGLSAGKRYFYVLGTKFIYKYQVVDEKIVLIDSNTIDVPGVIDDLTATFNDDVFITISKDETVDVVCAYALGHFCFMHDLVYPQVYDSKVVMRIKDRAGESRIDVENGWMVVSHGMKFSLCSIFNPADLEKAKHKSYPSVNVRTPHPFT